MQKDLYERVWKQSNEALRIVDERGTLVEANEAYCSLVGKARNELIGTSFAEMYVGRLREACLREELEMFSSRTPLNSRVRFAELWNGGMLWVETRSSIIELDAGKKLLLSIIGDVTERIKNEFAREKTLEVLRARESWFLDMIESSQDLIWETDKEGTFTYVNGQVKNILGLDPAEFTGRCMHDLETCNEGTGHPTSFSEHILAHRSIRNVCTMHRHKDGRAVYLESDAVSFSDERNTHLGYRGISRDVTARVVAEQALQRNEKKYRHLVDRSSDAIFIADSNGKLLTVNRAMCEGLKYDENELLSMTIWDILPREYREIHSWRLSEVLRGEEPGQPGEYMVKDKDGREHWVEVRSCPYPLDGNAMGFQAIARDITERRKVEEALRKSEAKLRDALEMARMAYWEYDQAGDLFTFNDQFYALYHTTVEQVGGYTMSPEAYAERFFHPDDRSLVRDKMKRRVTATDTFNTHQLEHRIRYGDGGVGYIAVRVFVVKDEQGRSIKACGVNQDITERRRAEEALVRERELLKTIIETTPDEVCLKDLEHRFVVANSASMRALGAESVGDLIGKTDLDFVSEALAREHMEEEEEIIRSGKPMINSERTQRDPSTGKISKCVLTTKVPVKDPAGRSTGILVVNRYITDRKHAEEALVRSEEEYRTMFETTGTAMALFDKDNVLCLVNKEFEKLSGYPKEESEGVKKWSEFVSDKDRTRMLCLHQQRVQGVLALPSQYEFEFLERSGDVRIVFLTINVIPGSKRCVASLLDITEWKRTENALKKSEMRYREFFEGNLAGAFISTAEGRMIDCNPALLRIFGFNSLEEALQVSDLAVFLSPTARASVVDRLVREGKVSNHEIEGRRIDGEALCLLLNLLAEYDEQGVMTHIRGFVFDASEVKRLQEQLLQAQKIQSLGTLSAGIAHDFNNILNLILGNAELLGITLANDEKGSRRVDTIRKAAQRGSQVVKQLLTFARKQGSQQKTLSIDEVLKEVAQLMEETLSKSIKISVQFASDLPLVRGDASQLHQVFVNLCVNARDAMPNGGELALSTSLVSQELVRRRFPSSLAVNYVRVVVRDTGTGMDTLTQKRVFDPFYTTKEIGKGTGLGLPVALGIVQNHGGLIDVQSELGIGTEFHVYLPAMEHAECKPEEVMKAAAIGDGAGATILVVEDEEVGRSMICEYLEAVGYSTLAAADGVEAVSVFERNATKISLVVSDFGLPKWNGGEVCRRIKALKPDMPFLLVSGFLNGDGMDSLNAEGADDHLGKPFALSELDHRISHLLSRARSAHSSEPENQEN